MVDYEYRIIPAGDRHGTEVRVVDRLTGAEAFLPRARTFSTHAGWYWGQAYDDLERLGRWALATALVEHHLLNTGFDADLTKALQHTLDSELGRATRDHAFTLNTAQMTTWVNRILARQLANDDTE